MDPKDTLERVLIHEIGHAMMAQYHSYRLNAVLVDLSRVPKGGVWSERRDNHDYSAHSADGNLEAAQQDTMVLLGGQVAEAVMIPEIVPVSGWSEFDNRQIDDLMIYAFATSDELRLFDDTVDRRSIDWEKWDRIDDLISSCRREVTEEIQRQCETIRNLVVKFQDNQYRCWGEQFHAWLSECEPF